MGVTAAPGRSPLRHASKACVRVACACAAVLAACCLLLGLRRSLSGQPAASGHLGEGGGGFSAALIAGTAAWASEAGASGRRRPKASMAAPDDEQVQPSDLASGGSRYNPAELMYQEQRLVSQMNQLDLGACFGQERLDEPMTQEQFLAQTPARLRLEHARFSPFASRVSITLVTAYDVSRLHMLDGLCGSWGGHLSAAVYQGVTPAEDRATEVQWTKFRIDDLWKRARQRKACALDVTLWSEVLAGDDPWMRMLFPVNSLRSRALLLARTEMVLVLDGDMLAHAGLHRSLANNQQRYQRLLADAAQRVYRVLAAFETDNLDRAYDVAEGSKAGAVNHFRTGRLMRFNPNHTYPQACTDYDRWQIAEEPYQIEYCKRYEPWGIVSRRLMPWFDERFRGYGRNKIVFVAALNATGFSFVVDHRSYVVHRPHEATRGAEAFSADARLQGHVVGMYLEQARTGVFSPVLGEALLRCRAKLPWWQ